MNVVATVFLLSICTWQFQEYSQRKIKPSVQNENCIVLLAKYFMYHSLISLKQHQQALSCLSAWCMLLWENAVMKKLPLCGEANLFDLVNKWLEIPLILPGVSFPCKCTVSLLYPYIFSSFYCFIDLLFRRANTRLIGTFDSSSKGGEN